MKKGDKVMCHNGLYPLFFLDNYYYVEYVLYDGVVIDGEIFSTDYYVKGNIFKDYFYTPTELRKIKINKLNGEDISKSGLF